VMYQNLPRDASFWLFLFSIAQDLAESARRKACPCGGRLHRANYPRKPRGGPDDLPEQYRQRLSFCCHLQRLLFDLDTGNVPADDSQQSDNQRPANELPPLLKKILAEYSSTGMPPAYLPKNPDPKKGEASRTPISIENWAISSR